jgi:hypothetical protein
MDARLDPLAEPLRCPHGRDFLLLADGSVLWMTPCRACEVQTVAERPVAVAAA